MIWSAACVTRLDRLLILQMRTVRIIGKVEYRAHAEPLFKKFGLLNLSDIGQQQTSLLIYKFMKNSLPESFADYFYLNSETHSHFTRQSAALHNPYYFC